MLRADRRSWAFGWLSCPCARRQGLAAACGSPSHSSPPGRFSACHRCPYIGDIPYRVADAARMPCSDDLRICAHRDRAATCKIYVCEGGAVSEIVSEATETDLQSAPASHGTMLPSLAPAESEAVTDVSLAAGPELNGSCVALPLRAEETAADDNSLLTSLPAPPSAGSPAEKAKSRPPADDPPNADGHKSPLVDSRPAYQSPSNTHPAQPEDGGAVRSTAEEQTRGLLPRAVAWEVPAGRPSPAASHAVQPRQSPGGRDRSVGVGHAPPSQVSASQPAAEGVHAPPVQRDAATSPVRDMLLPTDYADR